jgi:RNA recognition motif-containing protein
MDIFVGNFDGDTNEEDLESLFREYGKVASVTIWISSASKGGYGFVDMPDESEAELAIERLNGRRRNGRRLKVNKKRPRQGHDYGRLRARFVFVGG